MARSSEMDPDAARIRTELLEAEIQRLHAERRRVRELPRHWRACALHADSDAERETWIICADQLAGVFDVGAGEDEGGTPHAGGDPSPAEGASA